MSRFLFLVLVLNFFVLACQKTEEPTPGSRRGFVRREEACHSGVEAFRKTVYPHLRQDCLPCHDDGGMAGHPHASADMDKSYRNIISYINFSELDKSFFISKGGNLHCLNHPGGNCKSTEEDIRRLVRAWWEEGQKECPNLGTFISRPLPLPQTSAPQTLVFPLSHLVPELGVLLFSLEARREGSEYVFEKPRLFSPAASVQIASVRILQNGKLQKMENAWEKIQASTLPATPALLSPILLRTAAESTVDEISLSIQVLKKQSAFECKNLEGFQRDFMPVFEKRACYQCHGGGANHEPGVVAAKKALNMDVEEKALCRAILLRGNGKNSMESPLIALPLRGALGHARALPLASEVLPMWSDWVQGEGVHKP